MSEYSQSYHLLTTDMEDGRRLLERAGLAGWVFPAANSWVTLVVREEFTGQANPTLLASNQDLLLFYVNAEDHGWAFDLFDADALLSAYQCSWTDEVAVTDTELRLDMFVELLAHRDAPIDRPSLEGSLYPRSLDDVINDGGPNPAHRFANAVGLTWFEWISAADIEGGRPDLPAALIRVG